MDGEANDLETDQRGRDSRPSGEIPGEPMDDTTSIAPVPIPPIVIMNPSPRRGQIVRVQSPEAPGEPSRVVIQVPTSSSSSSSRRGLGSAYFASQPVVAETGYSRRTDATGRELESVISDFLSIIIIVRVFQPT